MTRNGFAIAVISLALVGPLGAVRAETGHAAANYKVPGGSAAVRCTAGVIAVSGIRQHTAELNTGCDHVIDLSQRDLADAARCSTGARPTLQPDRSSNSRGG